MARHGPRWMLHFRASGDRALSGADSAAWAFLMARKAAAGSVNTAMTASPIVFTMAPPSLSAAALTVSK